MAQQQPVPNASTQLRPKKQCPVMERDQRLTGDGQGVVVGAGPRDVLPQHDVSGPTPPAAGRKAKPREITAG
jgi:hypothetical protein